MKNDFILLISLGIVGLPFIQPSDTKPILQKNIPNKQIAINGLFEHFNNFLQGEYLNKKIAGFIIDRIIIIRTAQIVRFYLIMIAVIMMMPAARMIDFYVNNLHFKNSKNEIR